MKTKTLYIAYDGTEFINKNECRAYEERARKHINELVNIYTFCDKNKNVIFPFYDSIEEYLQWFDSTTDTCEYIIVHKDLSREAHQFLYENIGGCIPEKEGFYKYDWNKNEWVSAD